MQFDQTQAISIFDVPAVLKDILATNGLPPFVHGSPAIGKSSVAHAIAKEYNLFLIDFRLSQADPADLNGLPDLAGNKATFKTFDTFPVEGDPLPINPADGKPYNGWLLFLDEMNGADDSRQSAAYKLVLDRMVGQAHLHKDCYVIAAGNLDDDGGITNPLATPMISRFVHIYARYDLRGWLDKVAYPNNYDRRITAYLEWKAAAFYTFDPANAGQIYAAPRSWSQVNKYLQHKDPQGTMMRIMHSGAVPSVIAGTIGQGNMINFRAFVDYESSLPTKAQVLNNPEAVQLPLGNPGVMYALTGLLSECCDNEENSVKAMVVINKMTPDYQVVCLRAACRRVGAKALAFKAFQGWLSDPANVELVRN